MMRSLLLLGLVLLLGACNIPPKDPFVAAERALARNDLLQALQAYDAVPVKHTRYPDARAAAGDVEQRMRRCHELILEALMLRAEWRDSEALATLQRAADHWPGQPSLRLWIAATEKRLRLFGDRTGEVVDRATVTPSAPLIEIAKPGQRKPSGVVMSHGVPAPIAAKNEVAVSEVAEPDVVRTPVEVPARGPLPMVPMESRSARSPETDAPRPGSAADQVAAGDGATASEQPKPGRAAHGAAGNLAQPDRPSKQSETHADSSVTAPDNAGELTKLEATSPEEALPITKPGIAGADVVTKTAGPVVPRRRLPMSQDPVALGMVSVEAALGRGELAVAVRDLIELARRFPDDARVNRRLGRLLHQRALMNYGSGAVAAAVADWRRVLEIEPGNERVQRLLARALAETQQK